LPGTITQSISNSLSGTSGYALVTPGCNVVTGGDPGDHTNTYLNVGCVSLTPQLNGGQTFGPLSTFEGPGSQNYTITPGGTGRLQGPVTRGFFRAPFEKRWDVALSKKFPLKMVSEKTSLEFRAEAFKVFNNPIFSGPAATAGTATYGRITSTVDNTGRQLQFAAKVTF
jgi:hypothetical protein